MPERVATADSADFDNEGGLRSLLSRALGRYPRDMIAIVVAIIAAGAILLNALYRQPGPHPAPIFSIKPRPVAAEPADIVPPKPRARPEILANQKAEPPAGQKTEAPVRPRVEAVKTEAAPRAPAKPDPIAALITAAPSPKISAVQRALNDYAYGPVKVNGVVGPDTVAAIQKFERDHKMPVTGQISPRLMRELATLTGRPLE